MRKSIVFTVLISVLHGVVCAEEKIGFNEKIRPILNRSCTGCHGGVVKEGEVSFIYRKEALGKGSSGKAVIVPGYPEKSEMYRRIVTDDQDDLMPPPDKPHSKPLKPGEKELIKQWIKQGAHWEKHWAYEKPVRTEPKVSQTKWAKQPMDNYVLERLEKNGLKPTKPAEKSQWLRRVYMDLTGLPPSLEALSAFEKDDSSDAYEKVVDRLLISPRYGERWASVWMDLARYADTMGYEKDPHRNIWPYRDWLIRAFNKDMPYSIFLRDQLAGDQLKNPTADQIVATAFHRNAQTNTEGGTDDEEFRVMATIDRVNTTWTAMQGLTFGCTQCHSHPYEPIPHMDYYNFKDYFNNSEDCDLGNEYPKMLIANDLKQRDEAVKLQFQIRESAEKVNHFGKSLLGSDTWKPLTFSEMKPTFGTLEQKGGVVYAKGTHSVRTSYTLLSDLGNESITALRFTILPKEKDKAKLPERGAVLSQLELFRVAMDGKRHQVDISYVFADSISGPFKPLDSLNGKGGSGFGGYPKLFGERKAAFILKQPLELKAGEKLEMKMHHRASTTGSQAVTIRQFKIELSKSKQWQAIFNGEPFGNERKKHSDLSARLKSIKGVQVPVLLDRDETIVRETRLFIGGLWLNKGDLAKKGVPEILNDYKASAGNRLEMANWMVHMDNPLTARVMANRLFAELFGKGIVETLGDFGSTGVKPSNQALLDYLAVRFKGDYEWSIKKLLREMVLSATYRQDNRSTAELSKLDPKNLFLARGPRNRLSAEMVRDNALTVSGLAHHQLGGPSVMPPQPDNVWQSVYSGAKWKVATGPDRYRRALYTYWKRTSPYPSMLTFDAPSRDICTPQRIPTNTPLHALVTLNDPVFLECSQSLAKKMQAHKPNNLEEQIKYGYKLCTQREASPLILTTLKDLHVQLTEEYETTDHKKLANSPLNAATVVLANALMNIDDAVVK